MLCTNRTTVRVRSQTSQGNLCDTRMLPTRSRIFVSQIDSLAHRPVSLNRPEENDERMMSEDFLPRALIEPDDLDDGVDDEALGPGGRSGMPKSEPKLPDELDLRRARISSSGSSSPSPPPPPPGYYNHHHRHNHQHHAPGGHGLPPPPSRGSPARFPQTPFPSGAAAAAAGVASMSGGVAGGGAQDQYQWAWAYPSYTSGLEDRYPHSMPSCLPSDEYSSYPGDAGFVQAKSHSLPGRHSPSLASMEQPSSLRSIPPIATAHNHNHAYGHAHTHPMHPYGYMPAPQAPACYMPCHPLAPPHGPLPQGHLHLGQLHQLSPQPAYHMAYKPSGLDLHGHVRTNSTQSENAIFQHRQRSPRETQLSMEQRKVFVTYEDDNEDHVKEIIKFVALLRHNGFDTHIDVFEQQLNSISKIDCTERYIQELQNEFIQNGCKNFRFIPILFPGAKKSDVPTWLRNTHVYSWPKHRDDILRRLMRVEKYNPPPIGELPTIVSIPI
ncbi:E3 ubiquitin ligase TRAF3IP2-like isoform X2 [Engraulis encrasicolus]|uniref:E3 ubiquitin ligase TRAF3IP2-like isoform X2 n=1 Tax=Engraulis encrasicolus TaxID=184585 RepID=UPI002FCF558F